jgi:hypothetical protein
MTSTARTTAVLALLAGASAHSAAQDTVEYTFEFVAEWSAATHPESFPGNPHFSSVIGATHTAAASVWEPGGIASPGMEFMAEIGATTSLSNEVTDMVVAGEADRFHNLGGISLSPGARARTLTVNAAFDHISLVSMIAPSPDWFVGVHGVDLRPDGVWTREVVIDLDPYDAGTDAGPNYTSPNADITPHLPIANIADEFPFTGTPRIGTFRLTLLSDASCSLADLSTPFGQLDLADISTFVSAFTAGENPADLDDNGVFDLADISAFVAAFTAGCP